MNLIDIGRLVDPNHDFFREPNRAIFQLAQALEEVQGELIDTKDELDELKTTVERLNKSHDASELLIQELMERVRNLENPMIG